MSGGATPVITLDGPSGSGKGTIGQMLALHLGYNYLDSGALYRVLTLAANRHGIGLDNRESLAVLAGHMDLVFEMDQQGATPRVVLESEDVSDLIRTEVIGAGASQVAAFPEVRDALLQRQKAFARAPGLVADGRDMGTVVFPGAGLKIFLTASAESRAERRYNQLIDKEENVSLARFVEQIKERDERDRTRAVAPLLPAADAVVVDSTDKGIDEVFAMVLDLVREARSAGRLTQR